MKKETRQLGIDRQMKKTQQKRKCLDMVIESKLKNQPPSIMEKISDELGLDIKPK